MAKKGLAHSELMEKRYSMKGGNYNKTTALADYFASNEKGGI